MTSVFLSSEPVLSGRRKNIHSMTGAELQTYARFKTDKRRREWLAGRLAAKHAIKKGWDMRYGIWDIRESDIEICKTSEGIPFGRLVTHPPSPIPHPVRWPVSISHSGGWAVAAACPEQDPIGVDIEKIEERDPAWLSIAFHESELPSSLTPKEQTRLWTVKEAVLKWLGLGLTCDLWDVRISSEGNLVLHGKALRRHREMGSPGLETNSFQKGNYWISVAAGRRPS